jgi:hypothetical protein
MRRNTCRRISWPRSDAGGCRIRASLSPPGRETGPPQALPSSGLRYSEAAHCYRRVSAYLPAACWSLVFGTSLVLGCLELGGFPLSLPKPFDNPRPNSPACGEPSLSSSMARAEIIIRLPFTFRDKLSSAFVFSMSTGRRASSPAFQDQIKPNQANSSLETHTFPRSCISARPGAKHG